jgi:hypothetical protein
MTEYIPKFILDFEFNSLLGILMYWVPLVITAIDAIKQSYTDIRSDINERTRNYSRYTVGDIVLYTMQTVTPVVNLLKAVFVSAPNLLRGTFDALFAILDTPIIPAKKEK